LLRVEDVTVRFAGTAALDGASLEVAEGEVVALLGPSGSGKSTLLRVVAGLHRPDAGRVLLAGENATAVPPHRRGIGVVFQDQALFHHRDVWGNVAFGLRMRDAPRKEIERRVRDLLELVGLSGFERRSIATLSGGERQRVALARALAPEPRVLLLDEPLGSLDRPLRERLLDDLERIFDTLGVTALYITHDLAEAFALGDRVAILRDGRIVQTGTPDEVWARPASEEVARFLGLVNVGDGVVVHPEAVKLRPAEGETSDGVVEEAVRQGATVRIAVRLGDGRKLEAAVADLRHPEPGDRVRVEVDPAGVVQLPHGGGQAEA
jgi:thiamine transport system ATP-binding protein